MFDGLRLFGEAILTFATPGAIFNVFWATLLGITVGMISRVGFSESYRHVPFPLPAGVWLQLLQADST